MAIADTLLFNLPFTYAERLALEDEIRIPATLEEYLEFVEQAQYKVEFSNGKITIMGQPTDVHELICGNAIAAFHNLVADMDDFRVYGSNLGIYLSETGAHYKPDVTVLDASPEFVLHKVRKRTLKSVLNPFAAIEVFSEGTMDYDMTEKLPNYKQCPSLQYIIYIFQNKPFVTVYTRTDDPNAWLNSDYIGLEAAFPFKGHEVKLSQLYRKMIFMGNGKKKNKA